MKIDYTDSEHIWPGNDAAALLDGATSPLLSAADAHQAQQDDRLTALEGQLARTLQVISGLSGWTSLDYEWRQEVNRRLAHLETVAQRLLNPGEEAEP